MLLLESAAAQNSSNSTTSDTSDNTHAHTDHASLVSLIDSVVDSAIEGFSTSLVTFGISSTNKAVSLFGDKSHPGLIHLIGKELFEKLQKNKTKLIVATNSSNSNNTESNFFGLSSDFTSSFDTTTNTTTTTTSSNGFPPYLSNTYITASFVEIYNETVRDIFAPNPLKPCKIREDPTIGPYVDELTQITVSDITSLDTLVALGQKSRAKSPFNSHLKGNNTTHPLSSGIFTLSLRRVSMTPGDIDSAEEIVTKMIFSDLAGR